jgi:hypothetical protein
VPIASFHDYIWSDRSKPTPRKLAITIALDTESTFVGTKSPLSPTLNPSSIERLEEEEECSLSEHINVT